MGTNFYYKIPIQKRTVKELREMITEDPDYDNIRECLDELEKNHNIHLGKRSYGWQFLWDFHNGKFYGANLRSIKNFLETGGGYIINEYGEKFTIEQFFGDEIKDCLYKDKSHCDAYSYHAAHPEEPLYYTISDHEFSNDNLRFSKDEDFS